MSNVYLKVLSFLIATTICATNLPAQGNETDWVINLAPEECIMYLAWTGELSADENGAATEKWLAQKEIQSSIRALRDAIEIYLKANPANPMELNELARELPWLLMKQPFAVYLADLKMRKERSMPEFDKLDMGVVVDLGAKEKWMSDWIERMVAVVNENPNEQLEKQTIGDFFFIRNAKGRIAIWFWYQQRKVLNGIRKRCDEESPKKSEIEAINLARFRLESGIPAKARRCVPRKHVEILGIRQ